MGVVQDGSSKEGSVVMARKLDFDPIRHGYHFANTFTTRVLPGVTNGIQTEGLCGGMVMSALDYWRAGVPIPTHAPADFGNLGLPSEASRMRRYIFDRQMNSLLTRLMFTRWMVAPWIGPNDFHNWATGSEFEVVKNQIHQGRPVMLGLWVMGGNPTHGHQVLCYGYENSPKRLYVYDPNNPDEESILTPKSPALGCVIEGVKTRSSSTYRGYFFTDVYNWNESPPYDPRYRDLVVTSGISLSPEDPTNLVTKKRLGCSVTVTNVGEYPSRFKYLYILVRGPQDQNLDNLLGAAEPGLTVLQPGESRTIVRTSNSFGEESGVYTISVAYLSNDDQWIGIPPNTIADKSLARITLWNPKSLVVDKWFDVPESQRGDQDTNITLRPGDEYELTGADTIWAGVWLTGLNGPEGWEDRIETNPASPMFNRPDAHPFSLIGRFGVSPYFYIGHRISRKAYNLPVPANLRLRINDNAPGNGSGVFRCRVQVWR